MKRNLSSVADFAANSPFSEHQLRWLIFHAPTNGLKAAVVRVGRRVYIDHDAFDAWLDAQNVHTSVVAGGAQ